MKKKLDTVIWFVKEMCDSGYFLHIGMSMMVLVMFATILRVILSRGWIAVSGFGTNGFLAFFLFITIPSMIYLVFGWKDTIEAIKFWWKAKKTKKEIK